MNQLHFQLEDHGEAGAVGLQGNPRWKQRVKAQRKSWVGSEHQWPWKEPVL